MTTPVLTAQQRKKALSGKKKGPHKASQKLPLPYENYWPMLTDDEKDLMPILESILGPLRTEKKNIPFPEAKKLSKDERKIKRRALQKELDPEKIKLRQCLVLGVNAVTRALEKNTVCFVLLGGDVDPKDMIRHVIVKCAKIKVPLLLVPSLRSVTSTCLGYSTIALGLKKNAFDVDDHYFRELYQKVKELSSKFPIDELPFPTTEELGNKGEEEEEPCKPATRPLSSIYLYRTSTKERVFIPGQVNGQKLAKEDEFLSLNLSSRDSFGEETVPAGISYAMLKPKVKPRQELNQ